jgi:SAM-dependent methyltransferase
MISLKKIFFLACTLLASGVASAQYPYDVPYVPTPQVVVDQMLRVAGTRADDYVMDLGSGDGRILITAAQKFGARGVGVDLDEALIAESNENAKYAGVTDRVKFLRQDLFKTDLGQATVITMYLLPNVVARLRPALLDLKPGTRIVSHDFDLGDWKPDEKTTIRKNVFLWIVPAKVAGRWEITADLPSGAHKVDMELRQNFQEIDGLVRGNGRVGSVWEPRLRGERISLIIVDDRDRETEASMYLEGRVTGSVMEGEGYRGAGSESVKFRWRATRRGS